MLENILTHIPNIASQEQGDLVVSCHIETNDGAGEVLYNPISSKVTVIWYGNDMPHKIGYSEFFSDFVKVKNFGNSGHDILKYAQIMNFPYWGMSGQGGSNGVLALFGKCLTDSTELVFGIPKSLSEITDDFDPNDYEDKRLASVVSALRDIENYLKDEGCSIRSVQDIKVALADFTSFLGSRSCDYSIVDKPNH